ncbi:MAG: amino acid carrier protein [Gammaproteobacteria bacterium]|nr:amino acid carrier protein [Gammaproteobacteria bacterium]
MEAFNTFWANVVSLIWGLPLVILLTGAGAYFTIVTRFLPFRTFAHALDIVRGKYDNPDDPGEISHFQALSSALSATVGMGNIAGVAVAVAIGGPGAIFWMWVSGLVGMTTKFFTCSLACMYRKEDEDGIPQGGPMYFIEVGLGGRFKFLAVMFACCGMIGTLSLFQSNQLASLLYTDWNIPPVVTGFIAMVLVSMVVLGGITRIGKATARIVPAMCLLYFLACMFIVLSNFQQVPGLLLSIVSNGLGLNAALGGAAGVVVKEVMVTGIQRAAFSNEAGIGTAPMAHGAAKTTEPVREGMVAMIGPFIDTHVICTLTALVILISGVSSEGGGIVMTAAAFEQAMPGVGSLLLTMVVIMFAISSMISLSYYGLKCARYLFGKKNGGYYIYVYLLTILLAAVWSQGVILNIVDAAYGLMAIPTVLATLALSPKVTVALKDYMQRMNL